MGRKAFGRRRFFASILVLGIWAGFGAQSLAGDAKPGRDPKQPVDEGYTKKIREYTTQPNFTSPLVDYLPASPTVPTPKAILGDIAGAPGLLPYSQQV